MDETQREGTHPTPPDAGPADREPAEPPGRAAREPEEGPGRGGGSGTAASDPEAEAEVGGGD
jgi:hypothetical protein